MLSMFSGVLAVGAALVILGGLASLYIVGERLTRALRKAAPPARPASPFLAFLAEYGDTIELISDPIDRAKLVTDAAAKAARNGDRGALHFLQAFNAQAAEILGKTDELDERLTTV